MFVKGKVYTSGSYDDFTKHGHYVCSNAVNNAPVSEEWFSLTVFESTADNDIVQLAHSLSSKTFAWRTYSNQAWSGWRVENLSNLTTKSKNSLVDAVNEVNEKAYFKKILSFSESAEQSINISQYNEILLVATYNGNHWSCSLPVSYLSNTRNVNLCGTVYDGGDSIRIIMSTKAISINRAFIEQKDVISQITIELWVK